MNEENLSDESVQKDVEIALIEEEHLDENDERTVLITEIGLIQKEICELRSQLGGRYSKAYISMKEIMENMQERSVNNESILNRERIRIPHTSKLVFYGMFMKMYITEDRKHITVLLCVPGRQTFGLNFIKNTETGFYQLYRSCLPYSLKVEEEMKKAKLLSQMQIVEYVKTVRANIYAYQMRLDQVKQLQMILDKKQVDFFHSICYTHIELLFRVKVQDEEYRATLKLYYGPLEIRPGDMHIESPDNDIPNEYLKLFWKKLEPLRDLSLPEFYDTIFNAELPLIIS